MSSGPAQDIIVFVCHLDAYPYGPYSACLDGLGPSQVLADETQSGRVQQIPDVLREMEPFLADADSVPVFLLGDFNSPSHLDWTSAATALHCGYTIDWPVTRRVEDAGLVDSIRESHPDSVAEPGNTWSPIYETFTYPDGTPEPLDRIDMVHHAGAGVATIDSGVFAVQPFGQYLDHQDNEGPSDHAAVVSTFRVFLGGGVDVALPALSPDRTSYASGETIVASFADGPGNATDWIGLYPASDTPGAQPSQTWFYTNNRQRANSASGSTQGQSVFDGRSGPVWPLPAGEYRAFFLCCDGYAILEGPVAFTVVP